MRNKKKKQNTRKKQSHAGWKLHNNTDADMSDSHCWPKEKKNGSLNILLRVVC